MMVSMFLGRVWAQGGGGIKRISANEAALTFALEGAPASWALVELAPYEVYREGLPVVAEGTATVAEAVIPRFDGRRDRLYSKFQLVDAERGAPVSSPQYVTDLSELGARHFALPWPDSIKGITCPVMREDILELGVKYINTNVDFQSMFDWNNPEPAEVWEVDGEKLPINTAYFARLDDEIKFYTDAGINMTVVLNNRVPTQANPADPFIHPKTNLAKAPFHLGAINVTDDRGLRYYRGAMEYMANRYSRPDCRYGWITGYIVGNEVTAHWEWYNIGEMPLDEFIEHYGIAMRVADLAVRRFHSKARVYVSLEHHWNKAIRDDGLTAFRGKEFIERFNAWAKAGGDFPWHVAFHPYPEDLFEPRFWNDRLALLSFDSPKITFKNIEVLPAFLGQKQLLYDGQRRGIILSEQGFHAPEGEAGERAQAAAYACAYYKLKHMPDIDAFMLHRHVSARDEGGLRLGVRDFDINRKLYVYDVFRLADTDQWEEAFAFAKPIIGIEKWEEALPLQTIEMTPDLTPAYTLVDDGVSRYQIVVPEKRPAAIDYAARELQHFLTEMSGAVLPITAPSAAPEQHAICLSIAPDGELLEEDGVAIETDEDGGNVYLYGQNERGVIYSVYCLLDRYLGIEFLAPDCTIVPKRSTVTLPKIAYVHSPPFMYRETLYFDSFPKAFAVRQRLNGPASQCDAEVGGKWRFYPYVHSFCQLVPPDKYYDDHPEYFSLVNGERTRATIHGQLCLTNPDVLDIATKKVLEWLDAHPDVPIIDVSQNDGNGWCECEACAAVVEEEGSQHGPIMRFVNAIADAVAEKDPNRWVETLAYAYSTKPGAVTKPRDNVIIRLCHAGCYFHGFEACGLGANLTEYLDEWRRRTRRIFIWHYATNFGHYVAPNQNIEALAKDIKYYASHGVNGLMIQGNYQGPGGELAELRRYLAAQLMWNPDRNPDAIRLEFCLGYYGAAAFDVIEYLALMDKEAANPAVHAFANWDPKDTVRPECVARGIEILTRARTRAQNAETAARLERLMLPLWYMQLMYPTRYGLDPAQGGEVLAAFVKAARECGATHINEGRSMQAWIDEMTARYGEPTQDVAYDLYLNMWEADVDGSVDWRAGTILRNGGAPKPDRLDETYEALLPDQAAKPKADDVLLSIYHHPPAQGNGDATYAIALPALEADQRLELRFGTGFSGPTTNGVLFAVLVDGHEVWRVEQRDLAVANHMLDLSEWGGQTVALTLRVNALGDPGYDWANWVRPQIRVADAAREDARLAPNRHTNTRFTPHRFASKEEWEAFAQRLRRRILVSSGLWPMPERTPLNPRVSTVAENSDYVVEKVAIEAIPGFFVTGNLYRPVGEGPFPAVATPHGHWTPQGRLIDCEEGSVPGRCITFARMGIVAFSYDMVGYNDSLQFTREWGHVNDAVPEEQRMRQKLWGIHPFGIQLWSSIRAIDFLEGLPYVDSERMACTGASGGGTQTFVLTAIDPRIKVSAPVCMLSHTMQGGCVCENAPILRFDASNVEIGALAAPRPLLLVSASGDWTAETPEVEFPAIRAVYELYDAADKVENAHFDARHNYNKDSREAVYAFFGKWLLSEPAEYADFSEPPYATEETEALRVFPNGELPEGAPDAETVITRIIAQRQADWETILPRNAADLEQFRTQYGIALADATGVSLPAPDEIVAYEIGREEHNDYTLERVTLGRKGKGDAVPAALYRPTGVGERGAVLVVHDGSHAALCDDSGAPGTLIRGLLEQGKTVVTIDAFHTVAARQERVNQRRFPDTFLPTDAAHSIQDIVTALAYLKTGTVPSGKQGLSPASESPSETGLSLFSPDATTAKTRGCPSEQNVPQGLSPASESPSETGLSLFSQDATPAKTRDCPKRKTGTVASERDGTVPVFILGLGDAGLWCLFASALSGIPELTVVDAHAFPNNDDAAWIERCYIPCIRSLGDVTTAAALIAPRRLWIMNTADAFDARSIQSVYETVCPDALGLTEELATPEHIARALR